MTVSKERKAELTAQFGNSPVDTGNPKVQVAILSERIKELTEHMKSHQKDFHTRRGLLGKLAGLEGVGLAVQLKGLGYECHCSPLPHRPLACGLLM